MYAGDTLSYRIRAKDAKLRTVYTRKLPKHLHAHSNQSPLPHCLRRPQITQLPRSRHHLRLDVLLHIEKFAFGGIFVSRRPRAVKEEKRIPRLNVTTLFEKPALENVGKVR